MARDPAVLVQVGFKLKPVTPADRFIWTPHLEAVGLPERSGGEKHHWPDM